MFNREPYTLENGKLASFAFPGGYPLYYLAADNGVLCPNCANCEECQTAQKMAVDPQEADRAQWLTADLKQWQIVAAEINWEDSALYCDNCNQRIESAYAEEGE